LQGYIAWLKSNPDKASMGTVGVGSPPHLLGILMQKQTGARFTLVPYRGGGPLVQDVVAGQIDMTFINTASALPFVRDGSIKALGLTSLKRIAACSTRNSDNGRSGPARILVFIMGGTVCPS